MMKPFDVNPIADYIILRLTSDEENTLINLKLQKLLYYLQAWSLGITKEPFLNCKFEAWVHGPVCRELYNRFRTSKTLYSFTSKDDVDTIDTSYLDICEEDKAFINYILDNYAGFSGTELEVMTHKEQPWIEARHGIGPMESCNEVISEDTMRDFYGKKWNEINS